jgi:hypothetical protein
MKVQQVFLTFPPVPVNRAGSEKSLIFESFGAIALARAGHRPVT